jgi:hypothetical protein
MKRKTVLLPKQQRILRELGENIKLARLRRKLSADQVSTRANIAKDDELGRKLQGNYRI